MVNVNNEYHKQIKPDKIRQITQTLTNGSVLWNRDNNIKSVLTKDKVFIIEEF